jgi:hypothetical protein
MKTGIITRQKIQPILHSLAFLMMLLAFCLLADGQSNSSFRTMSLSTYSTSFIKTDLNSLTDKAFHESRDAFSNNSAATEIKTSSPANLREDMNMHYDQSVNETLSVNLACSGSSVVTIQLLSLTGNKVFEQTGRFNAGENEVRISTAKIDAGEYYIRINKGEKNILEKIAIRK